MPTQKTGLTYHSVVRGDKYSVQCEIHLPLYGDEVFLFMRPLELVAKDRSVDLDEPNFRLPHHGDHPDQLYILGFECRLSGVRVSYVAFGITVLLGLQDRWINVNIY